ncbi:stalk domain-containing protein [Paenibacillus sp. GCM10028914]|uniref:stalk domain-containing protein n=1 Tax=Paenibacillus sp. GCM10028914 TaxID=3273416 RepID=UPI0036101A67
MLMKKALVVSMVTAVVSTSVVSAVSAAPAAKAAATGKVQQSSFKINGNTVSVRSIIKNGETLVSVRDLITAFSAQADVRSGTTTIKLNDHTVVLRSNSKQIIIDGTASNMSQPMTNIEGSSYVAVRPLISGLGGTLVRNAGVIEISTIELLEGAENPRFAGAGKLIVSKSGENGRTDYLIDTASGQYDLLLTTTGGSDLVVAPSGDKAAYSSAEGAVYVVDLKSKASKLITNDNSIKSEFVWSTDGSEIYFLQGDKGSVIAKLSLSDGVMTKIVEDKVDYKENLSVSPDGKKFIYTVTTLGTVTSDATNVDEDNVSIDFSSNQTQINAFNIENSTPKASALTSTTDDKVFVVSNDGLKAYYVSVPSAEDKATLMSVDSSSQMVKIFTDHDVEQVVLHQNTLYVLAALDDTSSVIYAIDTLTGKQTKLYTVSSDVSSIVVNGSQIAIVKNDQVFVSAGDSWKSVTK